LWSNYLSVGLLWCRPYENHDLVPKPPTYIAPSWSWASVNSAVIYGNGREKIRNVSIQKACCTPAGLDPTGAVTDGYLLLSGPTLNITLQRAKSSLSENKKSKEYYNLRDYADRDMSANYVPDYLLEPGEMCGPMRLNVYGLILSPDFVMVLKKSLDQDLYERIGVLNFHIRKNSGAYDQPDDWARDAQETALKII